jgi:hypothetical protein
LRLYSCIRTLVSAPNNGRATEAESETVFDEEIR